jgi:hypothetical protein
MPSGCLVKRDWDDDDDMLWRKKTPYLTHFMNYIKYGMSAFEIQKGKEKSFQTN